MPGYPRGSGILIIRGIPWRSSRLKQFYKILDKEDELEKASKPKRGGKKERHQGPLRDGFCMPPKGVASWMISRRWIRASKVDHPDLPGVLNNIVEDPPGFGWSEFHHLGEASGDETQEEGS
jgi:hypothetical protein